MPTLALLAVPATLGGLLGAFFGFTTLSALSPRARVYGLSGVALAGLVGFVVGVAIGWIIGALLMKPVMFCAVPEAYPSTRPHSLFLAPLGGAISSLAAMLYHARKTGTSGRFVSVFWLLAVAFPTALALFFGKSTASLNALFRDCESIGPRLVANAALFSAIAAAMLVVRYRSRLRRRLA
jgi:hypothetical protein